MTHNDDHIWRTRSRHRTSAGTLSYQSCHYGLWRLIAEAGKVVADRIGVRPLPRR